MGKRTVVWCWVGDYLLEVSANDPVSKSEWGELMVEIAAHRERLQGVLVLTGSSAPTATQRAELTEALRGSTVAAAILSSSTVVRTALTAINFFVKGLARPFTHDQLDDALAYLQVPEALRPEIRAALKRIKAELDASS
jgi:hypothetical protein